MTDRLICPLRFWIETDKPLITIADKLVESGIIDNFDFDYENIYEWFTCRPLGYDYQLNVSRKHNDEEPPIDPLGFMLISTGDVPPESAVRELALAVHQSLKQAVTLGAIIYVHDDEFRYEPIQTIEHQAE